MASKGVRKSYGRGGMDQTKVYPQWGYTEKLLGIST
jgi:hypothetical protein